MNEPIYFDNAATTPICDEALTIFSKYSKELYYNASATYTPAVKVERAVYDAQKSILKGLGAQKGSVIFTSGGTESDNAAIFGAAKRSRKKHIITSAIEHPAVLNAVKELENQGYEATYLPVDPLGFVSPADLEKAITSETFCVSIMHVNNETGAVQDIKSLAQTVKLVDSNILFHSDGVQAYGNIPVDLYDLGVDMYSVSSHKMHGPKGVGALYIKDEKKISPILYGGSQQNSMRPGTLNSPGILSFEYAFRLAAYTYIKDEKLAQIKNYLADKISKELDGVLCINPGTGYSNHILSVAFKGVNAETLVNSCQYAGLIISTGAACSSKKNIVSPTLKAMNVNGEYIGGAVRLSFSRYNTIDEAKHALNILKENVDKLRKYT